VAAASETEADFDRLSWHDCRIWKLELAAGEGPGADLSFGLDLIVDWLCGFNKQARFQVAPAALTFHWVSDLRISVDCGDSKHRLLVHPWSIEEITRVPLEMLAGASAPDYTWRIRLNWPAGGELSFGASGFTQTLLAEPIISETQQLSSEQRRRMLEGR
jgi:hypothetical protein